MIEGVHKARTIPTSVQICRKCLFTSHGSNGHMVLSLCRRKTVVFCLQTSYLAAMLSVHFFALGNLMKEII